MLVYFLILFNLLSMKNKFLVLSALMLVVVGLAGCNKEDNAADDNTNVEVTDDNGVSVETEVPNVNVSPDGSVSVEGVGSANVSPDGSVTITTPNGQTVTTDATGSVKVDDSNKTDESNAEEDSEKEAADATPSDDSKMEKTGY